MPLKIHELLTQLEADGWFQVRQKGSHRQFHHRTKPGTVSRTWKCRRERSTASWSKRAWRS